MQASVGTVLSMYMKTVYYDLGYWLPVPNDFVAKFIYRIRIGIMIAVLATFTVVLIIDKGKQLLSSRTGQLVITSWFSLLATLSWLIVFKAHAVLHEHIVNITWQMPFTFFWAAAVTAASIEGLPRCRSAVSAYRNSKLTV
jgi:hypothetical protein